MITKTAGNKAPRHFRVSDARGAAKLASDAVAGVTRIVEGVHQTVWAVMGVRGGEVSGQTGGLTGLVYRSIHTTNRLVGHGLGQALGVLERVVSAPEESPPGTPERDAVLAVLNGVMGDRLAASGSPFAIPMRLRCRGEDLDWSAAPVLPQTSGRILLLIHGLFLEKDLDLWDIKIEWAKDAETGELLLIDEVSANGCRAFDLASGKRVEGAELSKRFRA